jgi:homoserine dehydrogenase
MNIDVGILGFGTVGAVVYKILKEKSKDIINL